MPDEWLGTCTTPRMTRGEGGFEERKEIRLHKSDECNELKMNQER